MCALHNGLPLVIHKNSTDIEDCIDRVMLLLSAATNKLKSTKHRKANSTKVILNVVIQQQTQKL
ncbi:CLUMA_CG015560, isoform A [Clunio marinus]|uniref:CLUMA_CG015560, isoform A n=1 Tax=Clunio marinus TaxID=568069 RepID=A0A1J1IPG8_9DIPT|nr:CLUMA_CG015560, isoform A [Clunio marinus]